MIRVDIRVLQRPTVVQPKVPKPLQENPAEAIREYWSVNGHKYMEERKEKRKDLGKIVSFYPLSLVQMDIYDLAKYYRDNQGYKYTLCLADVYSRKVWAYKMKNKDNDNVFDSFKQFI